MQASGLRLGAACMRGNDARPIWIDLTGRIDQALDASVVILSERAGRSKRLQTDTHERYCILKLPPRELTAH